MIIDSRQTSKLKNKPGSITAMWMDELTDSEVITAGCIRGSESA